MTEFRTDLSLSRAGGVRVDRRRLLQGAALGLSSTALGVGLTAPQAAGAQAGGGTVNVAFSGELINITPWFSASGEEQALSTLIFGSLVEPNNNLEPIPDLAESWEVSDDATTFTFKLRSGLTWSDGEPLTVDDVIFTIERAVDSLTGSTRVGSFLGVAGATEYAAGEADSISGLEAVDPQTLRITLAAPNSAFLISLQSFCGIGILPKHVLVDIPPDQIKGNAFSNAPTVGAGAYVFQRWEPEQFVQLAPNPLHYGGAPALEGIVVKLLAREVAIAQLESGEVDLVGAIPVGELERLQENPNIVIHSVESPSITQIAVNTAKPYLADKRVRQAFVCAIDRQGIIDSIYRGQAAIVNSPIIGPSTWMGQPEFDAYAFDPDRARALLAEAGWDSNQTVEMMYSNAVDQQQQTYQAIMQQQLRDVGVNLELRAYDIAEIRRRRMLTEGDRTYGEYDLYSYGGGVYRADPSNAAQYFLSEIAGAPNIQYYANPEIDSLFAAGVQTIDLEERKRIYTDIARILNDELPVLFLWSPNSIYAVSPRLQGFVPPTYASAYLWNAETWTIAQ